MNNPCGMKSSNTATQILNDLLPNAPRPELIRSEKQIQRTPVDSLLDQRPAPVLVTHDIDEARNARTRDRGPGAPAFERTLTESGGIDADQHAFTRGRGRRPQWAKRTHMNDSAELVPFNLHVSTLSAIPLRGKGPRILWIKPLGHGRTAPQTARNIPL